MSKEDRQDETMLKTSNQTQEYQISNEEAITTSEQTVEVKNMDEAIEEVKPVGNPEPYIKHPLQNRFLKYKELPLI